MSRGFESTMIARLQTRLKKALGKYTIVQKLQLMRSFNKVIEARIVWEFLGLKRGEVVCDVACGSGLHSIEMARRGCQVYGVDISEASIEMAKSLAKGCNCHFQVGDAENLPFESGMFDKVVSVCALEHFDDDEKALAEMSRVLKDDGILVLTVDSFTYEGIKRSLQRKHKNDHHVVNYYSANSIKQKLERHGFIVEKSKYFINSAVSAFFFNLGIRLRFQFLYGLTFPIAYPLSIVSDQFWSRQNEGYLLALRGRRKPD